MKKKLISLILVGMLGGATLFASMNFLPLKASSSDGSNQVIGSIFYLGTMNSDISASSIGVAAFYQNKLNDSMGIYANGGVGKAFAFHYKNISDPLENTVAVFIQSGPYYLIELQENMLVKVGAGVDIAMFGGKNASNGDENVALSFGVGAFGAYEYVLIDNLTLVGALNLGFDFVTWMTNTTTGDFERDNVGVIVNIMPSVGVSYSF
jgi:hypothetical protein